MEMEEATTDLFINLIQNNSIIFDKSLKDFRNVRKKEEVWETVANQSRMTVEAAKKRYFSLRQKYCREKRNLEVKRSNKQVHRNNWIYYERLNFLDAFIQPRATFTNDTGFVEDDNEVDGENEVGNLDELQATASQNVYIEVDESVDINELNNYLDNDHRKQTSGQHSDDSTTLVEEVVSQYTGDVSTIFYPSQTTQDGIFLNHGDNAATQENQQSVEIIDQDNYISPHPSSSSSHHNVHFRSSSDRASVPHISTRVESVLASQEITKSPARRRVPQTGSGPNTLSNSSSTLSQQTSISRRDLSAPKTTAAHQQKSQILSRSNPAVISNNSTARKTAPLRTAPDSIPKDKSIETIRHKMDSCLNAIANKMTDKQQRSPHAPFLAYLGTKLANVPKEIIANLEQEILDLVKLRSK